MQIRNIFLAFGLLQISLVLCGQPNITRIEYFIDTDPGLGSGISIPFAASNNIDINTTIDLSGLADGFHWIYLRGKDADRKWSLISGRFFFKGNITTVAPLPHDITRVEYFFDSDPGPGNGISIPITPGINININQVLDAGSISDGFHWIYIRGKDANSRWSTSYGRFFYKGIISVPSPSLVNVIKVEYFIDTDPGQGKGTPVSLTPGTSVDINQTFDVSSLSDGLHQINLRGIDASQRWSQISERLFYKGVVSTSAPSLVNTVRVEYYFDTDPGPGNGIAFTITPGTNVNIGQIIDVSSLSDGFHWFYTRSKDANGRWSHSSWRSFYKGPYAAAQPLPSIKRVEYFFDIDPGIGLGNLITFTPSPIVSIEKTLNISSLSIGEHKFAVRIQDSYGKWSYLTTRSFTNDITHPAAPRNPAATPGDSRVTLVWGKNTETDFMKYRIYHGNISGGETLADSTSAGIKDTTIVLTELTNNTDHYFYITAIDSARLESPHSIEVVAKPVPPVGLPASPVAKPATDILQNSFIANWSLCSTATGYRIDVATNIGFTSILAAFNNKDVFNVSKFTVTGLNLNTTYYYRLRAYNADGTNALASNSITVKTLLDPPPPPSPPIAVSATIVNQTSFVANWNHSTSATGYKLDISTDIDFGSFVSDYNKKDVLNVTNFPVTGLLPNTIYYYRVYAYNALGTGSYSNIISAKTLIILLNVPNPPAAIPATNPGIRYFTANWSSSVGATGYRLDVSDNSEFSSFVTGYSDLNVNGTSQSVTGLSPNTYYYYRARAYNNDGPSSNSGTIEVKTLINIPGIPSGLTASSCNDIVTLKWRKNSEPDFLRYRIYRSTSENPTAKVDSTTNGVLDTLKTFSGLTRGQTYYFRITSVNMEGNSSSYSNSASVIVYKGVKPKITAKWGDVLICSDLGDSISTYQWYKEAVFIPGATGQYYVTNKQPGSYQVLTVDNKGCENYSDKISISGAKSLSVYPNPATTSFSVKLNDSFQGRANINIFNSLGIKVMDYQINMLEMESINEIPVTGLKEGIYYLEIIVNNEKISYSRIVVIK